MPTCMGLSVARWVRCSCGALPSRYNRAPLAAFAGALMSFAFVFPGQGSQSVGMLAGFAEERAVRAVFEEASRALGYDLWELIQQGPAERLGATECQQPAMLAAGVALWRLWKAREGA